MSLEDDALDELRELEAVHRLREPRVRDGAPGAVVRLDGRDVLNFASNDYLGLAADQGRCDARTSRCRSRCAPDDRFPIAAIANGLRAQLVAAMPDVTALDRVFDVLRRALLQGDLARPTGDTAGAAALQGLLDRHLQVPCMSPRTPAAQREVTATRVWSVGDNVPPWIAR